MGSDVEGKRALFDPSPGDPAERAVRPTVKAGQSGKRSLFSAGERRPGTVAMHCSDCGARTRVSLIDYAKLHFPFWMWIPGRTYSRLLRCTACERLTWQSVQFFA